MGDNNNGFVEVKSAEKKGKSNGQKKYSFGKSVVIPFISGILGASLVVGICFNVPTVKEKLLGKTSLTTMPDSSSAINYNNVNTNLISLSSFSDTGVAVAQKVLPSIVGISVEYPISTLFSKAISTAKAEGSGVIISNDGYILTNNHVISTSSSNSFMLIFK